jgi:hypothetical protein
MGDGRAGGRARATQRAEAKERRLNERKTRE